MSQNNFRNSAQINSTTLVIFSQAFSGISMDGVEIYCGICDEKFFCCQRCWRNQKYCSPQCSKEARRKSNNKAQAKRRKIKKAKIQQSIYQKNHRARVKQGPSKKIVSQHTSKVQFHKVIKASDKPYCLFCKKQITQIILRFDSGGP